MLRNFSLACAIAACPTFNAAHAHHGLDFLLVQTAHLPEKGTGYAVARLDHVSEHDDELELEPAVLYGATDWMTVEVHAHYEKEAGEPSKYESFAPTVHFRLTPRERPFSVGISAEYEIAHTRGPWVNGVTRPGFATLSASTGSVSKCKVHWRATVLRRCWSDATASSRSASRSMPVSVLDSTTAPTNRRARHSFGVLTDIRRAMIGLRDNSATAGTN